MKNDSIDDALDRIMNSRGFVNSKYALKGDSDRNFRHVDNPRDHIRAWFHDCGCHYQDDTYTNLKCSCLVKLNEHEDTYFPEHFLDIKGATGHVIYDIAPYIKEKFK